MQNTKCDLNVLDRAALVLQGVSAPARGSAADRRWPSLETLGGYFDIGEPQVGDMPPAPASLRAKIGAVLIQLIRRALFWYSAQIVRFQKLVTAAANEQLRALQQQAAGQRKAESETAALKQRLDQFIERTEQGDRNSRQRLEMSEQQAESRLLELKRELDQTSTRERDLIQRFESFDQTCRKLRAELKDVARIAHQAKVFGHQQSLRISMLLKEARRGPEAGGAAVQQRVDAGHSPVEQLILDHANVFRGDRAEIMERLRVYVPHVRGASGGPALDLGCGRGEWLELMRGERIPATGVDSSVEMVAHCAEMGFDTRQADVLTFLRGVPDQSYSIVTAFHVVEHLPFEDMIELLDHTVRILKRGGLTIFETPNPRNLHVASYGFYLDPTHIRPLPSELLAFLAELRGLTEVETLPLHPYPPSFQLEEAHCCAASRFINEIFFGPQDYAIIGKKA